LVSIAAPSTIALSFLCLALIAQQLRDFSLIKKLLSQTNHPHNRRFDFLALSHFMSPACLPTISR
jgi:hypothetical protein